MVLSSLLPDLLISAVADGGLLDDGLAASDKDRVFEDDRTGGTS